MEFRAKPVIGPLVSSDRIISRNGVKNSIREISSKSVKDPNSVLSCDNPTSKLSCSSSCAYNHNKCTYYIKFRHY